MALPLAAVALGALRVAGPSLLRGAATGGVMSALSGGGEGGQSSPPDRAPQQPTMPSLDERASMLSYFSPTRGM